MPGASGCIFLVRPAILEAAMGIFTGKQAWYSSGLAFECVQCGRCCEGPEEGYVWVNKEEIVAIARHLGIPEGEMRRRYLRRIGIRHSLVERRDNKDCVFLAADQTGRKRCRIYPVRPRQCRTWPFWASNLASPQSWAMAQLRCPGINRGAVHRCEEIEAKCRATSE